MQTDFHNLYTSPNISRVFKLGHLSLNVKITLERILKTVFHDINWIYLAQDRGLVDTPGFIQ